MSEQERNNAPGGPAQGPEKPPRGGKEGRAALRQTLARLAGDKRVLAVFSLLVAFFMWFVVISVVDPNQTATVRYVPVNLDYNSAAYQSYGPVSYTHLAIAQLVCKPAHHGLYREGMLHVKGFFVIFLYQLYRVLTLHSAPLLYCRLF